MTVRTLNQILPASLIALFIAAVAFAAPDSEKKIKVLILDGQNNHNWKATTPVLKDALESCGHFSVDVSTSPAKKSDAAAWEKWRPNFSEYDAVVSNYNGEMWPEEVRKSFEEYVSGGGGFIVIHAANNSFSGWEEYNKMIGVGGWGGRNEKSGPWLYIKDGKLFRDTSPGRGGAHGPQRPFTVKTQDADHPIMKGLPAEWMHAKDELYTNLRGPGEGVTILASALAKETGKEEPMVMTIPYGEGRVFHTPMGHADYSMRCRGFYTVLQRGTEWAATGDVKATAAVPEDFPGDLQGLP